MKILHITDIHSNFDTLRTIIVPNKFDLLLISGDITHFGGTSDLKTAIEILDSTGIAYYAVTGNCDKPECEQYLRNYLKSIDSNVVDLETVSLTGLSGSLHCPGKTPNEFSEKDFAAKLSIIEQKLRPSRPFIFVAHQPPYNTLNDKLVTGMHTGSKNIRKFIEKHQPVVCLTGHIHEGKGVDYIGECPVINPGPLRNGHFAIIELTGKSRPHIALY